MLQKKINKWYLLGFITSFIIIYNSHVIEVCVNWVYSDKCTIMIVCKTIYNELSMSQLAAIACSLYIHVVILRCQSSQTLCYIYIQAITLQSSIWLEEALNKAIWWSLYRTRTREWLVLEEMSQYTVSCTSCLSCYSKTKQVKSWPVYRKENKCKLTSFPYTLL